METLTGIGTFRGFVNGNAWTRYFIMTITTNIRLCNFVKVILIISLTIFDFYLLKMIFVKSESPVHVSCYGIKYKKKWI
jgi:hypothetical protein